MSRLDDLEAIAARRDEEMARQYRKLQEKQERDRAALLSEIAAASIGPRLPQLPPAMRSKSGDWGLQRLRARCWDKLQRRKWEGKWPPIGQ